jgi:hypothetical protein
VGSDLRFLAGEVKAARLEAENVSEGPVGMPTGRVVFHSAVTEEAKVLKFPFVKEPTVQHASRRDIEVGVRRALDGLRMTLPELRDEARTGDFRSQRARLVWSAIRDVVPQD